MHVIDIIIIHYAHTYKYTFYTIIPMWQILCGTLGVEYNVYMLQTDSQIVKLDILTFSSVPQLSTLVPESLLRG